MNIRVTSELIACSELWEEARAPREPTQARQEHANSTQKGPEPRNQKQNILLERVEQCCPMKNNVHWNKDIFKTSGCPMYLIFIWFSCFYCSWANSFHLCHCLTKKHVQGRLSKARQGSFVCITHFYTLSQWTLHTIMTKSSVLRPSHLWYSYITLQMSECKLITRETQDMSFCTWQCTCRPHQTNTLTIDVIWGCGHAGQSQDGTVGTVDMFDNIATKSPAIHSRAMNQARAQQKGRQAHVMMVWYLSGSHTAMYLQSNTVKSHLFAVFTGSKRHELVLYLLRYPEVVYCLCSHTHTH